MLLRFFQSTGLKHVKPTCFGDQMNRAGHQYCLSGLLRETAKIQGGFLNSTHVQNPKWLGGWYGWLNRLQHFFEPTLGLLDPAFPKKLAARARPPRRWACSGTPGSLRLSRAGLRGALFGRFPEADRESWAVLLTCPLPGLTHRRQNAHTQIIGVLGSSSC